MTAWSFRGANPHLQAWARSVYLGAVRRGELVRQPCEVCGDERVDGHHEDYAEPLRVVWLCRLHHRWRHMESPHSYPQSSERHASMPASREAAIYEALRPLARVLADDQRAVRA